MTTQITNLILRWWDETYNSARTMDGPPKRVKDEARVLAKLIVAYVKLSYRITRK